MGIYKYNDNGYLAYTYLDWIILVSKKGRQ